MPKVVCDLADDYKKASAFAYTLLLSNSLLVMVLNQTPTSNTLELWRSSNLNMVWEQFFATQCVDKFSAQES